MGIKTSLSGASKWKILISNNETTENDFFYCGADLVFNTATKIIGFFFVFAGVGGDDGTREISMIAFLIL